jgi:hypothetical protein
MQEQLGMDGQAGARVCTSRQRYKQSHAGQLELRAGNGLLHWAYCPQPAHACA